MFHMLASSWAGRAGQTKQGIDSTYENEEDAFWVPKSLFSRFHRLTSEINFWGAVFDVSHVDVRNKLVGTRQVYFLCFTY